mmetsp:Transcript_8101/g.7275  ORF Transcript_8101/g.7275 Transcript_8101/m.7275 type:complete len:137 (-) Transcript_8101:1626-2036(-)
MYAIGIKKLLKQFFADCDKKQMEKILDRIILTNLKAIESELPQSLENHEQILKRAIIHKNLLGLFERIIPDTQEKWIDISKRLIENIANTIETINSSSNNLTSFLINLDVVCTIISYHSKSMFEDKLLERIIAQLF